jgi:glycosidase
MDPARLARHTRVDKLPTVLDFAFRAAVAGTAGGTAPTSLLWRLFADDALYEGGTATAMQLPTFLGNHDDGRFAMTIRKQLPNVGDEELLARDKLAHAMLLTLRGAPVIYSGDEQGFTGDGGDQDAREDMFASQVASYNDNKLVGSSASTAQSSFNTSSPLYREIAALAALRQATPALRRGAQIVRAWGEAPGLFAVSRFDPGTGQEVLIAFNTATKPLDAQVEVEVTSLGFTALRGTCVAKASAPGSVRVTLPPLGYAICAGTR